MGRVYLDVARLGGRTAKLARLGAPSLTWLEFDALMLSIKDGSYRVPAQSVAPVAPTPAPSTTPHVGLPASIIELAKYRS
jgi:hypothetical protein